MRKKHGLLTKLFALVLTGVMAAGMCGAGNVVKAQEGDVEINKENFPDDRFRQYVSENFDQNDDGTLTIFEIVDIKDITFKYKGGAIPFYNLKGIENFTYLKTLDVEGNYITSLDLSGNPMLRSLNCKNNDLTSLVLIENEELIELNCVQNDIEKLDVSMSMQLQVLECGYNNIEELDVTRNYI